MSTECVTCHNFLEKELVPSSADGVNWLSPYTDYWCALIQHYDADLLTLLSSLAEEYIKLGGLDQKTQTNKWGEVPRSALINNIDWNLISFNKCLIDKD